MLELISLSSRWSGVSCDSSMMAATVSPDLRRLRLLQNGFRAERFDRGGNLFRLVADDGNDFFRVERQAGADDVIHKRAASGMMEDFCEAGLEACAFASGEDEDSGVVVGHGQSIVHWTRGFDNAGIRGG